jgi:hypothetical protein
MKGVKGEFKKNSSHHGKNKECNTGKSEQIVNQLNTQDRGITRHELEDPDFIWLITNYQKNHPEYGLVNRVGIPIVLIDYLLSD